MSANDFLKEYASLPEDFRKEVDDFIGFLKKKLGEEKSKRKKLRRRKLGLAKGKAWISPDFDEPLDEMKEYMK